MFLKNTFIKRLASFLFETNETRPLQDIKNEITPTVEITPIIDVVKSVISDANSATIYTTPTDKDFFLTNASYSYFVLAQHDGAEGGVTVVVGGETVRIVSVPTIYSQHNDSGGLADNFGGAFNTIYLGKRGVLLDRGSQINVIHDGSAIGIIKNAGTICGYIASDRSGSGL